MDLGMFLSDARSFAQWYNLRGGETLVKKSKKYMNKNTRCNILVVG
jgi:hypothetical protein